MNKEPSNPPNLEPLTGERGMLVLYGLELDCQMAGASLVGKHLLFPTAGSLTDIRLILRSLPANLAYYPGKIPRLI